MTETVMDVPHSHDQLSRLLMFESADENACTRCISASRNAVAVTTAGAINSQVFGASRITSPGFLSSRKPMKTGARNFPSRVHSANLISATNFGLTQLIFFIIEGVMPSTHCP